MSHASRLHVSDRTAHAVREATQATALTLERGVCVGRIVFFGAVLARFFLFTTVHPAGVMLTTAPLALGIGFSAAVLLWVKRAPGAWLWWTSVTVDALAVFSPLLANALWPTAQYTSVVNMPDAAALLVSTMAAGLRLSPAVALFGGVLNLVALVALVAIDRVVSGNRFETSTQNASLYLLWIGGATIVASVLASTTQKLAIRSATTAVQAEQAERNLWTVLAAHHDAGSMLTSIRIDAELICRHLDDDAGDGMRQAARRLELVIADLSDLVTETKKRAADNLEREFETVVVSEILDDALERARRKYPNVAFRCDLSDRPCVVVAGGRSAALRMLSNILDNACEGDGDHAATRVQVAVDAKAPTGRVTLRVRDNGPGLKPFTGSPGLQTSKPGGTGVGVQVARGLAEASGGSFRLTNCRGGGCEAVLTLQQIELAQNVLEHLS